MKLSIDAIEEKIGMSYASGIWGPLTASIWALGVNPGHPKCIADDISTYSPDLHDRCSLFDHPDRYSSNLGRILGTSGGNLEKMLVSNVVSDRNSHDAKGVNSRDWEMGVERMTRLIDVFHPSIVVALTRAGERNVSLGLRQRLAKMGYTIDLVRERILSPAKSKKPLTFRPCTWRVNKGDTIIHLLEIVNHPSRPYSVSDFALADIEREFASVQLN
jgi:hypothetical protein